MISILTCIGTRHDPWLVTLAMVICLIGARATVSLVRHAAVERGSVKYAWIFFSAIVIGTTAWTAHSVSVLGYISDGPTWFDPTLTIGSLLISMTGAYLALVLASLPAPKAAPALGGALLGLTIAVMHYTGMLAYRVDGIVRWDPHMVAVSVILSCVLCAVALGILRAQVASRRRDLSASLLLVAAMLAMHFTGMTAMKIVPFGPVQPEDANEHVAALAIAIAAGLIIFAGSFAGLIDSRNRREAGEQMAALALVDRSTGFPNRAAFRAQVRERCQSTPPGDRFAIIAMDIANMPAISEQFGTRIADLVLQATGNRILQARKQGVFLARTGEARFCGVGRVTNRAEMLLRASKLHATLCRDLLIEGIEIAVDIRLGGVVYPDDAAEPELLFGKMQAVLARAIADPLRPIAIPDEVADAFARRRLAVSAALRGALARGEFELLYQPQVRITDRHVAGYEALLRWHHPVLGTVSPAEFIPAAEETGGILSIGEWILHTACREATCWPEHQRVAVNVSVLQLRQPDMAEQVRAALAASGLSPDRLEIELTESLLIEDRSRAHHVLRQIKALGVRLALDDFGTGYSSMDVLRIGLFDKVKLDKSFVADIETEPQACAILRAMLALGRELSMPILAEGVETDEQLAILQREGCDKVQGYLTGRPMSVSMIAARRDPATARA